MTRQKSRLAAVGAAGAAFAVFASGSLAANGAGDPFIANGPSDRVGIIKHVADGDTLDFDAEGDGTATPIRIRMSGIQAMELSVYSSDPTKLRGECHGVEATLRLRNLAETRIGRAVAIDGDRMSGSRARRFVATFNNSTFNDLGATLIKEGHALPMAASDDPRNNKLYFDLAKAAAANKRNMWDDDACGVGPSAGAALTVLVNADAPGSDADNLNGEWLRITNGSATAVPVAGWWIRDSALRRFTFPAGASVAAGGSITVRVGSGTKTATTFYWGLTSPAFDNVSGAPNYMQDGGYLFDPQGDLRAYHLYG